MLKSINYIFDPLEQFNFIILVHCSHSSTNNLITCIIFNLLTLLIFNSSNKFNKNIYTWVLIRLISFIKSILTQNVRTKKAIYLPYVFNLFLTILIFNFLGMIPFTYTLTSTIVLPLFLSSMGFIGITLIGIIHHKTEFVKLFIPNSVPKFLISFLFIIESISYFSRLFSLAIRLFANMMAGHTLMKIIVGFVLQLMHTNIAWFSIIALFPWVLLLLIICLEIVIAFLQAYVFTMLSINYLKDVIDLH